MKICFKCFKAGCVDKCIRICLSFCLFLLSLSSVFCVASMPFVFVFSFTLSLGAISHNRPSAGLLRRIVSQTVSYAFYVIKLSFMSRVSLTSSLLPLPLLSFLPSSSPLFHRYPHLTPFSSLFLPLFCRAPLFLTNCIECFLSL